MSYPRQKDQRDEGPLSSGQAHAMTISIVVVGAVDVVCRGLVWLLPRVARAESGESGSQAAETVPVG